MKKIVFLTGTRADFGKLKSLIKISQESIDYDVHIFVTGMHLNSKYGLTVDEIYKSGFKNIYQYINHDTIDHMDRTLAKTIEGFSLYITEIKPDLIVVHGDRVEALAGAIVGSLNNILVAHIEGGELSGTIDELIRHSVSKLSHIHLVANETAKKRLIQLGEFPDSVFILGSPDLDIMNSKNLIDIAKAKKYYDVNFTNYSIAIFHPITTEYKSIQEYSKNFVKALIKSNLNYIIIYPNNDLGSSEILNSYKSLEKNSKFKIFPSVRFEYFLSFLKHANFIIGNSSAGIREAPFYNVPTIDIGTRQNNRLKLKSILSSDHSQKSIQDSIDKIQTYIPTNEHNKFHFGEGNSDKLFIKLLGTNKFWNINCQKQFQELNINE